MRPSRILIAALLAAASAAPSAQDTLRDAAREAERICREGRSDTRLAPLMEKLYGLSDGTPTLQMLSDKSTPTSSEQEALVVLEKITRPCFEARERVLATMRVPELLATHEQLLARQRIFLASLYTGELTFGEYNRFMTQARADWRATVDRVRGAVEQQRRDEARQLAAAQAQQWRERNRQLQEITRPLINPYTQTNCDIRGNSVSCSSSTWPPAFPFNR